MNSKESSITFLLTAAWISIMVKEFLDQNEENKLKVIVQFPYEPDTGHFWDLFFIGKNSFLLNYSLLLLEGWARDGSWTQLSGDFFFVSTCFFLFHLFLLCQNFIRTYNVFWSNPSPIPSLLTFPLFPTISLSKFRMSFYF